ncbi:hypothetical protein U1Q18_045844 [Sarracenia purpurea var. burkii]
MKTLEHFEMEGKTVGKKLILNGFVYMKSKDEKNGPKTYWDCRLVRQETLGILLHYGINMSPQCRTGTAQTSLRRVAQSIQISNWKKPPRFVFRVGGIPKRAIRHGNYHCGAQSRQECEGGTAAYLGRSPKMSMNCYITLRRVCR